MNIEQLRTEALKAYPSASALLTAYFEATHQANPKSLLIARSVDAELTDALPVNAKIKAADRAAKDAALDALIEVVPMPVLRSEILAICDMQKSKESASGCEVRRLALESLERFIILLDAAIR